MPGQSSLADFADAGKYKVFKTYSLQLTNWKSKWWKIFQKSEHTKGNDKIPPDNGYQLKQNV